MKKRVLITGGNGLLGRSIISCNENRFELLVTGKQKFLSNGNDNRYSPLDILDSNQCDKVFSKFKPDYVIHAAAMTHVDKCEEDPDTCNSVNVDGTNNILKTCEKYGSHLIFISTDFIFDGKNGSYSENSKPNPISIYGMSKWNAEKLIRTSTIDSSIVRTSLVMGYFEDLITSNIILWAREKLSKGQEISIVNDQIRTPTWSMDLAEGCFLLIENRALGIYNISGSEKFRISELIMRVADHGNYNSNLIKEVKTKELGQIAPRPLISDLDISKARRNIGFNPHSFKDVLDSMPYI
tara:strand:+ start:282 stop:1169 length:888 start_codon:yes stop_codon:yes gene_type:complete